MTPEVRRKALATAAKAAMMVTLGCSAPPTHVEAAASAVPIKAGAPAPSCDAYLAGLEVVEIDKLAPGDPVREAREKGRGFYGAFADVAARSSPHTQECCMEALLRDHAQAKQRFACCSAIEGDVPATVQMACTPWGPPWPPEMV